MTTTRNFADIVQPDEMRAGQALLAAARAAVRGEGDGGHGPWISFTYGGRPSAELLPGWALAEETLPGEGGVVRHVVTRTDPASGLQVIVEFTEYPDFPVIEWTARFRNTGTVETAILQDIRALDVQLPRSPGAVLHHFTGDYCAADGYQPHCTPLLPGAEIACAPMGGRPTNKAWPYYNLECPDAGRGVIAVVGWSGQWAARFSADEATIHLEAGQELTHFALRPGEEARAPISVLLPYAGEWLRGQNVWRRWMMAYNLPRPGGELPAPMLTAYTGRWFEEMALATEETQIAFLDRYLEEGIQLDYWWMDAGWYPCDGEWWRTGTWAVDRARFPGGLRAVCDHAHARGLRTLVWFEPERVFPGTELWQEHPEWLLDDGTAPDDASKAASRLLNLGHPDALPWLIERVSRLLVAEGIDLYRQDFNMEPLPCWRHAEAPDRVGLREMRHVAGYLAFWRALRQRFPDMLIDSCASGGRRNDLETMRLSVPLHKTDYDYADLTTRQAFHHSLALWLPYFGAYVLPVDEVDTYGMRSALAPMTMLTYDLRRRDIDWQPLHALTEEWRRVTAGEYFYGDYYPLTPYNRDDTQWLAWQYHRPDRGTGLVQAFRRPHSPYTAATYQLHGLDPAATYTLTNLDTPDTPLTLTGASLLTEGLPITMTQAPQAAVIMYALS